MLKYGWISELENKEYGLNTSVGNFPNNHPVTSGNPTENWNDICEAYHPKFAALLFFYQSSACFSQTKLKAICKDILHSSHHEISSVIYNYKCQWDAQYNGRINRRQETKIAKQVLANMRWKLCEYLHMLVKISDSDNAKYSINNPVWARYFFTMIMQSNIWEFLKYIYYAEQAFPLIMADSLIINF